MFNWREQEDGVVAVNGTSAHYGRQYPWAIPSALGIGFKVGVLNGDDSPQLAVWVIKTATSVKVVTV